MKVLLRWSSGQITEMNIPEPLPHVVRVQPVERFSPSMSGCMGHPAPMLWHVEFELVEDAAGRVGYRERR